MTFRSKLLIAFTAAVVSSVTAVTWIVSATTRRTFEKLDTQRTAALVAQFRGEFARRGEEVARRVAGIAESPEIQKMAVDLSRAAPDYSPYVNDAAGLATSHALDFLELLAPDGTIISSAQWPARFGYKEEWVLQPIEWKSQPAFLRREELPEDVAIALIAARVKDVTGQNFYVVGGQKLNQAFLGTLVLPAGMRALIYRVDPSGVAQDAGELAPLVESVRRQRHETITVIGAEAVHAIPLFGRERDLLGVLLVGSSRRDLLALENSIRNLGIAVGSGAILLGLILAWWATAHVTRPVQKLVAGARQVTAGNWNSRVEIGSSDEIGELGKAFNQMTQKLAEQRERLLQAERVAAWRELARRLAHELKNPLFPLQITIENLRRAREQHPEQFDEVFRESTVALLDELGALKRIVGQFSDFAKMPAPVLETMSVNDIVRQVLRLFEAQFSANRISCDARLDARLPAIEADAGQLSRALQNLVLNAMDAMPHGGKLTIRTESNEGLVRLEVADTGEGLTKEECERLFTPYYTTKQHGTGLGLAIVQSVVSDHAGRISVESKPGQGTAFRIELPARNGSPADR